MDREFRHDLGYWMSILGFAVVVTGGIFGALMSIKPGGVVTLVGLGFLVFLLGAEMALRNGKHDYPFHHGEE